MSNIEFALFQQKHPQSRTYRFTGTFCGSFKCGLGGLTVGCFTGRPSVGAYGRSDAQAKHQMRPIPTETATEQNVPVQAREIWTYMADKRPPGGNEHLADRRGIHEHSANRSMTAYLIRTPGWRRPFSPTDRSRRANEYMRDLHSWRFHCFFVRAGTLCHRRSAVRISRDTLILVQY